MRLIDRCHIDGDVGSQHLTLGGVDREPVSAASEFDGMIKRNDWITQPSSSYSTA